MLKISLFCCSPAERNAVGEGFLLFLLCPIILAKVKEVKVGDKETEYVPYSCGFLYYEEEELRDEKYYSLFILCDAVVLLLQHLG